MFMSPAGQKRLIVVFFVLASIVGYLAAGLVYAHAEERQITPSFNWGGHKPEETTVIHSYCYNEIDNDISEKTANFKYDIPTDQQADVFAQITTIYTDGTWLGHTYHDGPLSGKGYYDMIADWRSNRTVSIRASVEIFVPGATEPIYYEQIWACQDKHIYAPFVAK